MSNNTLANKTGVLYLIISVVMIVPFANDVFIASFPAMSQALNTQHIQLMMSVFLGGLAISQLFYGPLLDRFGRRPILIAGISIFTLASAITAFTPNFTILLIGRFLQAIGACSFIASILAIIRDVYPREKTVKMIAVVMAIIGVCPSISPLIGSWLQIIFGWRASLILLFIAGACYLLIISFFFKETMAEKNQHALKITHIKNNIKTLLKHRTYIGYVATSCFSYATIFSYIAASPFLLMDHLHVSVAQFGVIVAINALALVIMSTLAPKLERRFGLPNLVLTGTILITTGGALLWILNWLFTPALWNLLLPIFITFFGIGTIRPTASAGAMRIFPPTMAGQAAAVFSFASFVGGAVFSALANFAGHHTIYFASLLIVLGILGIISACQTFTDCFHLKKKGLLVGDC